MTPSSSLRRATLALVFGTALASAAAAQGSHCSLQFHGTGNGVDRALVPVDDNVLGPDASTGSDAGIGDFTLEFWVKGALQDNATTAHAEGSYADDRWKDGNVLLDRTVQGLTARTFGVSLAGGRVAFFTGAGDATVPETPNTLVGSSFVLDTHWHHVAIVRDAALGTKRIYVDGVVDVTSPANTSRTDLSYPDRGIANAGVRDPWLVIGASKYDTGHAFAGWIDELRVWTEARSPQEIPAGMLRRMLPDTRGLAADWRFEEAFGQFVSDSSARHGPSGTLIAGQPGNGSWADLELDAGNAPPIGSSLPIGFRRESIAPIPYPIALDAATDGRIVVANKLGAVYVWDGTNAPQLVLQLAVETTSERGLLGLTLDPAFTTNGFFYVFYTTQQPRNRVSRFTLAGGAVLPASEFVIWQTPDAPTTQHSAGALDFGPDGKLYVSTGDQYTSANSQDLTNPHGKILRLNTNGTVPSDNPFVTQPSARPEIWAYGLRNPFRMRADLPGGRIWVADVGGNGPQAYEEICLVERGANYGWPLAEGPECHLADCSALRTSRFHYKHDSLEFTGGYPQAALITGPVYRGSTFPPKYSGNLFACDLINGWLWRLEFDAAGNVSAQHPFVLGPDMKGTVDLTVGADGALYGVTLEPSEFWRIRWAGLANVPPVPEIRALPASGPAPLAVQFTGSLSIDPDQGPSPVTYQWDFGDGATSTLADPQHTYTTRGIHAVTLHVSDGTDSALSEAFEIAVGAPPQIASSTPQDGQLYRAGDTITFSASATDLEDGALPASAFEWTVVLVHENHTHPFFGPFLGAAGSFTVPPSGHGPEHTSYELRLAVRDSDALVTRRTIHIAPRTTTIQLRSWPEGITLSLDGEPFVTPRDYQTVEGFAHVVDAPATIQFGGQPYLFDHWISGSTSPHRTWTAAPGGLLMRAIYRLDDRTRSLLSISAQDRNAEWRRSTGGLAASPADPIAIAVGFQGEALESGFEFALPLPRNAIVESARLVVVGAKTQAGNVALRVRAYDVGNAPPFVLGARTMLSRRANLTAQSVSWSPAPFLEDLEEKSPDLTPLVQAVVSRPDWAANNVFGLVVDAPGATALALRSVRNFASGSPARLEITWRPPPQPTSLNPGH